ncbi:response regulator [Campylobacter curvus]|uniref:response regulator n=1 Tax=Campylobacter curvus TaxID=200 RepID=UPI00039E4F0E|nr:response regulator [Campylobacter curvus]UEB49501.1 response regulator [Campylobacter curvus]
MYNKIKEILKDVRLLIVEDDDELRATLKDSVEKYVKQIFEYSNAKDALACFKQNDINLILSDINMPRMSEPQCHHSSGRTIKMCRSSF